jgi:hypothetical protein
MRDGSLLLKKNCYWASDFHEGLAAARLSNQENSIYYINTKGEVAIETGFESAGDFSEGWAAVKKANNSAWQFINHQGKSLSTKFAGFAAVQSFHGGWARVNVDLAANSYPLPNKVIYLNLTGKTLLEGFDDWLGDNFEAGLAIVRCITEGGTGSVYNIINDQGQFVVSSVNDTVRADHHGDRLFWIRSSLQTSNHIWSLMQIVNNEPMLLCRVSGAYNKFEPFLGDWAKFTYPDGRGRILANYVKVSGELFIADELIDQEIIDCHPGREGLAVEITNGWVNYIDHYGRTVFGYKQNPKTQD